MKIKKWIIEQWMSIPIKWRNELVSIWNTFFALFIGELAVSPALNSLFKLDLPTVIDWRAICMAIGIAVYRSVQKTAIQEIRKLFKNNDIIKVDNNINK